MIPKSRGFTLIELMIAISILSLLMFTGTYAYQLFMSQAEKSLGTFEVTAVEMKNFSLLQDLVIGIQPYIIWEKNHESRKPTFFFEGHEHSLLSISHSGIYSTDNLEIFRLSAQAKENGKTDLIVQTLSSDNLLLLDSEQELLFENELVLFRNLDTVEFSYYGWNHFMEESEAIESNKDANPIWHNQYSGLAAQMIPEIVKIIIKVENKESEFIIDVDKNSLHYLTPYLEGT